MSERAAFAPKDRYSNPDSLGAVFVNDDISVNIREAVRLGVDAEDQELGVQPSPRGFIVTDHPAVIAVLDNYEPLKRVALADAETAAKPKNRPIDKGKED